MGSPANVDCPPSLRYVTDAKSGYGRKKSGKGFVYFDTAGKRIGDAAEVARIKAIGIPPAYERVWICPQANGHIQATGFDAKGRKQYRYHPKWRAERDADKFDHILKFGTTLPAIRARVELDLKRPGLPREKAVAAVVALLEKTLIRVGNAEYARENRSYGLTTLKHKHVDVTGAKISFQFTGKSGKKWNLSVTDRRVTSADVNDYLKHVASRLGNTPAVCRKSYVHPVVLTAYLDDDFTGLIRDEINETFRKEFDALTDEEVMVLAFLRKRMAKA